jgi:lysozyme family protein
MSNIEKLVPFIIKWEASTIGASLDNEQLFEKARKSGWSNDPADKGGATMIGVTIGTYKSYCARRGLLTPTNTQLYSIKYKIWLDVLRGMYWNDWKADRIKSQSIANILVDWKWLSGKYGITIPQRILGLTEDGIVGDKTIAAVNDADPAVLFKAIVKARTKYIDDIIKRNPINEKFRRGWMNRLNDLTYDS